MSHAVIYKTIEHFNTIANFDTLPRSGQPKSLSPREKQALASAGLDISPSTVRHALNEQNLRKWRAKKTIPLT
ncbi:unnamed protein product [Clonostachys rhizophaga]|uniref:Uncharacterized protein n=1 Tax=Clonostachys rhizophaga TaxID=160324 RepID=A0A9N9VLD0_9HYPO|nr:unnamed protein product [Clonostachys rhizophaga]